MVVVRATLVQADDDESSHGHALEIDLEEEIKEANDEDEGPGSGGDNGTRAVHYGHKKGKEEAELGDVGIMAGEEDEDEEAGPV